MTPEQLTCAKEQAKRMMVKQPEPPQPEPQPTAKKKPKPIRDQPIQIYLKRAKSITLYSVQASKGGKRFTAGDFTSVEDACRAVGEWKGKINPPQTPR